VVLPCTNWREGKERGRGGIGKGKDGKGLGGKEGKGESALVHISGYTTAVVRSFYHWLCL